MKGKKVVAIALAVIVVLVALYPIATGFLKQGNVYIADYSVSDDGTEITLPLVVSMVPGEQRVSIPFGLTKIPKGLHFIEL